MNEDRRPCEDCMEKRFCAAIKMHSWCARLAIWERKERAKAEEEKNNESEA